MITLADFNALDKNAKAEVTWGGKFLADRKQDDFKVQLYSLEKFYVEVFYDSVENRIIKVEAFEAINRLALYF